MKSRHIAPRHHTQYDLPVIEEIKFACAMDIAIVANRLVGKRKQNIIASWIVAHKTI
jgi:hypothetical protein